MHPSNKIITQLPLSCIWNSTEELDAKRISDLSREEIIEILSENPVKFVIASIGEKLHWIDSTDLFNFWDCKNIQP